jgi:hypothetical protein
MRLSKLLITSVPVSAMLAAMPANAQQQSQQGSDRRVEVTPYIEVSQVLFAELSPGDDVLTFTQVAAGVDASAQGRNAGGSVSLRYERNIGYGNDDLDTDTVSGVARGYVAVVPNAVNFEAGALASRTTVDGSGASTLNPLVGQDAESRIYSAYAGPTVATKAGDLYINGGARVGYTRVETPTSVATDAGGDRLDVFNDSVSYQADLRVGTKAGEALPIGIGVGGRAYQEDISNLDQRVRDLNVRADVAVPLSSSLSLVGGVGYEDVEISARDALTDADGNPVVDDNGRFVTDPNSARQIAFDVDGIIWDAGVVWRPSSRTALEARVGRRYDSTTYYGSFAYAPSDRSVFAVNVYDGVQGFGGALNNSLAGLPTEFSASRNPLTGDFTGGVSGGDGAGFVSGVLGSVRSATFRSRGVNASFSRKIGPRYNFAVAGGYDRRKFLAAEGTVLGAANGLVDESYYVNTSFSGEIGRSSSFALNAYSNWFESEANAGQSVNALGASASYQRTIVPRLSARAAVAYDYLDSDISVEDISAASGLVGLRYDF